MGNISQSSKKSAQSLFDLYFQNEQQQQGLERLYFSRFCAENPNFKFKLTQTIAFSHMAFAKWYYEKRLNLNQESKKHTMKQAIKNRMKELDLNLIQLHKMCGVRYATLSGFINGEKQIRFHNLEKICKALNLELSCC